MTNEAIRELASEHRFVEIQPETEGRLISFVRNHALGRIRINFWEIENIVLLIICKDKKGYRNFRQAFPAHDYDLIYRVFHNPNSFRNAGK